MVKRFESIHKNVDILGAAESFLALMRIDEPTEEQTTGALLLGEFVLKINRFLTAK